MAETVHLFLKVNGTAISGESTQTSLGRENSIECVYFEQEVKSSRDSTTGAATGRRIYEPILIRKRIDKATPLLAKAMTENATCDATFKFYRPHPLGDGTTEQFFSIDLKKGRVSYLKTWLPAVYDPDTAADAPMEDVRFVFHTIDWTYTNGGVTHEDTWDAPK